MNQFTNRPQADKLMDTHTTRLCMCECETCANRSPHPIYNCYPNCEAVASIKEEEKLQLGVYRKCQCTCSFCLNFEKNHRMEDCMVRCGSQCFKRI